MAGDSKVRFKASDIWDAPEDHLRYEVIDGGLYTTPPCTPANQLCLGELLMRLIGWIEPRKLGFAMKFLGLILSDEDGVVTDIIYISRERAGIIQERGVFGAPDRVVEVLSTNTEARDRGIKARRYAATGVQQNWLLNPKARAIEQFVLGETGFEPAGMFGPGSTFRPALFPG